MPRGGRFAGPVARPGGFIRSLRCRGAAENDPVQIVIEPERPADHAAVRAVVLAAFADHPSVAELVELIRASPEYVPELALVARVTGEVAGFVMVSHAELADDTVLGDDTVLADDTVLVGDSVVNDDTVLVGDNGRRHRVLTLSPLTVAPGMQGRGIGSALVPAALRTADQLGEPLVLLEGSPRYYPRFGFRDCRKFGISITLPDWAPPDAGMMFPLSAYDARVRGRLVYPPAFAATGTGHS